MKHLVIIGAGDFGRELYWHAQKSVGYGTDWDLKGYLDGNTALAHSNKLSLPFLGTDDDYMIEPDDVFSCAICSPPIRKKVVEKFLAKGAQFLSVIHETAIIQGSAQLGQGIILCPRTMVNDHAVVGDYVMLNELTTIGHDAVIGNYTCAMAHVDITGFVKVGCETYWGSGARALPHSHIGDNAFVGAGSVVLKRVRENDRVFGVPAVSINN